MGLYCTKTKRPPNRISATQLSQRTIEREVPPHIPLLGAAATQTPAKAPDVRRPGEDMFTTQTTTNRCCRSRSAHLDHKASMRRVQIELQSGCCTGVMNAHDGLTATTTPADKVKSYMLLSVLLPRYLCLSLYISLYLCVCFSLSLSLSRHTPTPTKTARKPFRDTFAELCFCFRKRPLPRETGL
jgi:hypothetical protein